MKNFKKVIAGALALLMLALSVNVSFAAEEKYSDKEAVVVAKVNAAGIMQGTDKGFEPSKSLTRAEAAAIIVRMKGISESAVKATAGATLFTDVAASHWASGYVNQASNLGIVKGVSATQFAPDREVTVAEFTTMAVRALGAGQLVDSEGTWPTNYVNFANEEGLLDDVNAVYTATATRLQAATIVVNSLTDAMWKKVGVKSNGEIEWSNEAGETILTNVLKLKVYEKETAKKCTSVSTKDNKFNNFKVAEGVDLTGVRVGLTYDFYTNNDNEILGLWVSEDAKLNSVEFTEIDKVTTSKVTLKVDGSEKEYKINSDTLYYENEVSKTLAKNKEVSGVAYLDDDTVSVIYGEVFEKFGIVDEVKSNKVVFDKDSSIVTATAYVPVNDIVINDDDNEYFLSKDGNGMEFADLEEGDAICFYTVDITGGKKYVAEVVTNTVEGKVTAMVDADTYKIDGTKYDFLTATCPKLGDEIVAYLTKAGKVVMFEKVEDAAAEVAVVSYYKEYKDKYNWTNADVKLTFTDGTQSEMLSIDVISSIESLKELSNVKEVAGTPDSYTGLDENDASQSASYSDVKTKLALGSVICYEISGDELTVVKESDEFKKEDVASTSIVVTNRSKYIKKGSTIQYYLTDATKVYNIKVDGTYGRKVEELDVKSLDDTDLTSAYYVAGIDTDSKEVEYVFLTETSIKRTTEANFAFVTGTEKIKYNNKTAYSVSVVNMSGEPATYTYYSEKANSGFSCPAKGDFLDITVEDEFIIDGDKLPADPDGTADSGDEKTEDIIIPEKDINLYVKDIASKRNEITLNNGSDKIVVYSDDVLVMLEDDGKYSVADLIDIVKFDATLTKNVRIKDIYTYVEDDEEVAEATVIVINNIKAEDLADSIIKGIKTNDATKYALYDFEVKGNKIVITEKAATDTTLGNTISLTYATSKTVDFTITVAGDDDEDIATVATYVLTYAE